MKFFSCILSLFFYLIAAKIQQINRIMNGNFTNPGVSPSNTFSMYDGNIYGWACTTFCKIENCTLMSRFYPKVNNASLDCSNFVIDLNSIRINQQITQALDLTSEYYWLKVEYLYPQSNSMAKTLQILFNQKILFSLSPNVSSSIEVHQFKARVSGKDGINALSFRQLGYQADGKGFKLANMSLYRDFNQFLEKTISYFFELQFLKKGSAIPGGRILFRSILSYLVNFDRLQFYSYHNRQYSANINKFLNQIRLLQSAKGSLIELNIRQWFPKYIEEIDIFFEHSEKKMEYKNYNIKDDNEKHQTFANYIKYFLTFIMPIIIIIFVILHIIFHCLKNWAISIVLRPYAFYATFIFVALEGNLEQIAFHGFGDLRYFFSFNFKNKLINCLCLSMLFIALFTCFGLYLWLRVHYSKKIKIITDSRNESLLAIFSMNFDKGMVIFLLGFTHQILLQSPKIQMLLLITIEIIWLLKVILTRKLIPYKALIVIYTLSSLLRIYFQISTIFYSIYSDDQIAINNQQHSLLIYAFIIMICLDILLKSYFMLYDILKGIIFRKNNVAQSLQKSKKMEFRREQLVKQDNRFQQMDKYALLKEFQFNRKIVHLTSKYRSLTPRVNQAQKTTYTINVNSKLTKMKITRIEKYT